MNSETLERLSRSWEEAQASQNIPADAAEDAALEGFLASSVRLFRAVEEAKKASSEHCPFE